MDNTLIIEKLKQLHTNSKKMRDCQKEYFRYRGQTYLQNAKYYERKVDQLIKEIDEIFNSKQAELFNG